MPLIVESPYPPLWALCIYGFLDQENQGEDSGIVRSMEISRLGGGGFACLKLVPLKLRDVRALNPKP